MPTKPVTYRVSPEVDAELRRLAKLHGGIDKALRVLFGWTFLPAERLKTVTVEEVAQRPNNRSFRPPLLKPSEQKKGK